MATVLAGLHSFPEPVPSDLREVVVRNLSFFEKGGHSSIDDNGKLSKLLLSAANLGLASSSQAVWATCELLRRVHWDAKGAYWPAPDGARRDPEFDDSRWCSLALLATSQESRTDSSWQEVTGGAGQWLVRAQHQDGYWTRSNGSVFEPNYCTYALLVLGDWLSAVGHPGREFLPSWAKFLPSTRESLNGRPPPKRFVERIPWKTIGISVLSVVVGFSIGLAVSDLTTIAAWASQHGTQIVYGVLATLVGTGIIALARQLVLHSD